MPVINPTAIPLFADKPSHPFVPLAQRIAVARSGGPGRPIGRRERALPWTAASTMAGLPGIGRTALAALMLLLLMPPINIACSQEAVPLIPVERVALTDSIAGFVAEASQRFGIPTTWIQAIIAIESANDPYARSPKGAMGLMQIMPATWTMMRGQMSLSDDPFDPRDNILAGTAFLRQMLDRYGAPGFLAAYNAGSARYEEHLATGKPLPAETRTYLAMLAPMIGSTPADSPITAGPRAWKTAPLFIPASHPGIAVSAIIPHSDGLFVRFAEPRSPP